MMLSALIVIEVYAVTVLLEYFVVIYEYRVFELDTGYFSYKYFYVFCLKSSNTS